MTTIAATTDLAPASPTKLSQRVRVQLEAASARLDDGASKLAHITTELKLRLKRLFPVPTRGDIKELSARLDRLEQEIDRLVGLRAKPAAAATSKRVRKAKPAAKKTSAPSAKPF